MYPRFDQPFVIHTDASNYQLGAVIAQNGGPIAFFSRKLNSAQKKYTTIEQELLSIVETLKEFKNILWGHRIVVYTDHKNLVHETLLMSSDRVMRWRLLLEEFGPEFRHIPGEKNVVADTLSREDIISDRKTEITVEKLFATTAEPEEIRFPLEIKRLVCAQQRDIANDKKKKK